MKEIRIAFDEQFDTQKHLEALMNNLASEYVSDVAQKIGLMLYGFTVSCQKADWIVYKSHNEVISFLKKFNKKYKQKLTFEGIQLKLGLQPVNQQCQHLISQDWFQQFCEFDPNHNNHTQKKKSLVMKKKAGGRYFRSKCFNCCAWKNCKIIIRNDGIVYMKQTKGLAHLTQNKNDIRQFLHFGKDFNFQLHENFDFFETIIYSYHRKLNLRAKNEKDYLLFVHHLSTTLRQYKKHQQQYRFNSFAPVRNSNEVTLFVDGQDYYESLAYTLQSAKQQIFMCGWWISPEFHLIRPCQGKNLDYRLDNVLRRVAKKNVKIYIIVYYESSFLSNDSGYTKQALQQLHQNIKVIRHPNIILPTFWSHHQKLVVIDQMLAHMGGLDICYGRYDTQSHEIDDNCQGMYPGIEYNNSRIKDFVNVRDFRKDAVQRNLPRLPWHDIAMRIQGECVKDLSRHFIEYWNYASYQIYYADRNILLSKQEDPSKKKPGTIFQNLRDFANGIKTKIKHEDSINSHNNHQNNQHIKQKFKNKPKQKQNQANINNVKIISPSDKMRTDENQLIDQKQIQVTVQPQLQKKTSIHQRVLSRLSPTKKGTSSDQNLYTKLEVALTGRNSKDQAIRKEKKIEEKNVSSRISQPVQGRKNNMMDCSDEGRPNSFKIKEKKSTISVFGIDPCKELECDNLTEGAQIYNKNQLDENLFRYTLNKCSAEEQIIEMQPVQVRQQQNDNRNNALKMIRLANKKNSDDDMGSVQSDFIHEKDQIELKKSHFSSISDDFIEGDHEQANTLASWMKKIIFKPKQHKKNQEKQAKNKLQMRMSDQSDKNVQEKEISKYYMQRCQVLRSVSQWSIGCKQDNTQKSISLGYLSAIRGAKKLIYIENQFFISATHNNGVVKNRIMEAIADRVIQAINMKQQFRVVIFMPLIPGFAGELDDPNAAIPRVIMNWQYRSLSRDPGSLFARISKYTRTPQQYIEVYSLRKHGVIDEQPKTQIIYIHSKLIIIDDSVLICGSANINDRSMQGDRDSQLCVYIDGNPNKIKQFSNKQFPVVNKIHKLRIKLWSQHFGIPKHRLQDPFQPNLRKQMLKIANTNTKIYRQLFGCYPDDNIRTLSEIKTFKRTPTLKQYEEKCQEIVGHVVMMPLLFLEEEKLTSYHPNAIST